MYRRVWFRYDPGPGQIPETGEAEMEFGDHDPGPRVRAHGFVQIRHEGMVRWLRADRLTDIRVFPEED